MRKLFKQKCKYCKIDIYWNSYDKSMKSTGSWHEFDLDILHDMERCKIVQESNQSDIIFEKGGYKF